jgi:type IV secretion system protein VirB4
VGDNPADWYPALTGHAWPGVPMAEDDLALPATTTGELPMQQAAE